MMVVQTTIVPTCHRLRIGGFTMEEQTEWLERIQQLWDEILAERGGEPLEIDVVAMIHEMREEQDERNLGCLNDLGERGQ